MVGEHLKAQARRVVSGTDEDGRSTIVADGPTASRIATPAFTICDIWVTESLPVPMDQEPASGEISIFPPKDGFHYRVVTFPPDKEWDIKAAYQESLAAMDGADTYHGDADIPGMHVHDTVDIVTVVSGEIYAVFEKSETLLRPGDSVIVRGAMHTWSNRGDVPCTITSLMMSAAV
jgi:mannose-6-phosphate isomerase-like protein (cupin superfamily)